MNTEIPMMCAGSTPRFKLRYVDAATRLAGGIPSEFSNSPFATPLKTIWYGIVSENCPNMTLAEMAKYSGMNSHGTVAESKQRWFRMPWRDRHGWLLFAEEVVNDRDFFLNGYNLRLIELRIKDLRGFFENPDGPFPEGSRVLGRGGFLP